LKDETTLNIVCNIKTGQSFLAFMSRFEIHTIKKTDITAITDCTECRVRKQRGLNWVYTEFINFTSSSYKFEVTCSKVWVEFKSREDEVREWIPVPHDNYLKFIISSHPF